MTLIVSPHNTVLYYFILLFLLLLLFFLLLLGNDGPLWGSILNPADQADVLSVGGWNNVNQVASFSSRGMTTMEAYTGGMGRVKPDVLAPSVAVYSSASGEPYKCTTLSGTSVATPVISGAVAVLLSYAFKPYKDLNEKHKVENDIDSVALSDDVYDRKSLKFLQYKNIATMKQILVASAKKLESPGKELLLVLKMLYNLG